MICGRCLRAARVGLRAGASASHTNLPRSPFAAQAARLHSSAPAVPSVPALTAAGRMSKYRGTTRQQPLLPSHLRPYSTAPAPDSTPSSTPPSQTPPTLDRPAGMTEGEAAVWDLLSAEFAPTELEVQDISGGCGSMYSIDITAEKFRGLNMLKQQRIVNSVLADMVKEWHGLQLRTKVP